MRRTESHLFTPVSGELCLVNSMGTGSELSSGHLSAYSIDRQTRFINPMFMDAEQGIPSDYAQKAGIGGIWGVVDPVSPTTFYFSYTYDSGVNAGKTALIKAQYQTGPQCVYQAYSAGANHPALVRLHRALNRDSCLILIPVFKRLIRWTGYSSCMAYTNVTLPSQGRDVDSQIQAQPNYKPIFGTAGAALATFLAAKPMLF